LRQIRVVQRTLLLPDCRESLLNDLASGYQDCQADPRRKSKPGLALLL
jgi:hypothetical protein